ncbi:MAG: hypothetical protein QW514_07245 [Thermoprotei archaeon]
MPNQTQRRRRLGELLSLIAQFEANWEALVSRGALNSEGRKVCVRIGTLAGHLYPDTPYNVRWVLGDFSDAHVKEALYTIRERVASELESLGVHQ